MGNQLRIKFQSCQLWEKFSSSLLPLPWLQSSRRLAPQTPEPPASVNPKSTQATVGFPQPAVLVSHTAEEIIASLTKPTTSTLAPAPTSSSDDTSGSDDGSSSSSSSGEEDSTCTSQTFDPNPDCSADQDKYCDAATYGADNTMCLYCDSPAVCADTMCIAGFTDEEKQTMLTAHNDYRRKVAKGEETDGAPGPQPTA